MDRSPRQRLLEVVRLFLRLGLTAYGGPAAHIAMMHDEVVKRRKWLTEQEFLDLLGATNLIPGPNSTEMAIHISFLRAGWPGLMLGGAGFILPPMLAVLVLAWVYVRYGTTPTAEWLLYGVKPVVIAIILQALWNLGRKALKGPLLGLIGVIVLSLFALEVNELVLMIGAGLVVMAARNVPSFSRNDAAAASPFLLGLGLPALASAPVSLPLLFLIFLKVGAVLYGSGYVLLAFLRADLVTRLGWLTDQQLLDAITIGQLTPGPVFTTATFIGYVLGDLPGALLATLGIFLPSFIFVAVSNPIIPRLRSSAWAGGFLDGVNAAALGLMAAVTWQLGRASLVDIPTIGLALMAAVLLFRFKVNSVWLILGGAVIGWLANGFG
jgi:chromate transporter